MKKKETEDYIQESITMPEDDDRAEELANLAGYQVTKAELNLTWRVCAVSQE